MKNRLRAFWTNNKYDIMCLFVWCTFWTVMSIRFNIDLFKWEWWTLSFIIVATRFIGYKEGMAKIKDAVANQLLHSEFNIAATSELQTRHKLGDVPVGTFFSVVDKSVVSEIKEPLDKYLKVEVNDAIKVTTWNMTKQKFTTLSNDLEVILYSCKSIYTPKLETDVKKEGNNEL